MKQNKFEVNEPNIFGVDIDLLTEKVHHFLKTTDNIQDVKKLYDALLELGISYGEIIILLDPKIKKALGV